MPYDTNDPRAQLGGGTRTAERPVSGAYPPQYFEFGDLEPDEVSSAGTKTWIMRSQSMCIAYSDVAPGDSLARHGQPDEYMVLVPSPDAVGTAKAGNDREPIEGKSVVVMPPGDSELVLDSGGQVIRVFSTQSPDLVDRCRNRDLYDEPDPNVAPWAPWPDPPAGHRVRVYPLDAIPQESGRFGRLLRCSTVMVNYFYPDDGARDPHKLSPHHHDDFEQISLQLEGDYVHHIRTPWTVDMDAWRDDDHHYTKSPAVTVIPPPTVHTSQGMHEMRHQLIDIFAPPRFDFSERPGWVLNADEYPMP